MKKSELQQIIREEISKVLKEKIANESGNIFHEYNGKRFKKVAEGKWMEVSKYGMTKQEHESKREDLDKKIERLGKYKHVPGGGDGWGGRFIDGRYVPHENTVHNRKHDKLTMDSKIHRDSASKLSDKEHTDEEVGLGKNEGMLPQSSVKDVHLGTRKTKSQTSKEYPFFLIKDYMEKGYWDKVNKKDFKKAFDDVMAFLLRPDSNTSRLAKQYDWIVDFDELWQYQLNKED